MRFKSFSLFVVIVALLGNGSINVRAGSARKEKIVGTVIAYDRGNGLFQMSTGSGVQLIVRAEPTRSSKARFIKISYFYVPGNKERDGGFPTRLVDSAKQWKFTLVRVTECDSPIREFLRVEDKAENNLSSPPIWELIPGAAKEVIPFGQTLPCYSLDSRGFSERKR